MAVPPVKIRNIHLVGEKYYVMSKTTSAVCLQGFKESSQHKTGEHIRPQMFCRTFLAFALFHAQRHALAVNVADFERDDLAHPQPGPIGQ